MILKAQAAEEHALGSDWEAYLFIRDFTLETCVEEVLRSSDLADGNNHWE